ncbi:uncharacterized protein [Nicotiana tomentosiformis]|uniref:uncharacterized protein n=1 Tax=Nicotiana tomentosiformis TaxID=4098 RepID=UPI0014450D01|nr:uncharacterized protein LOC108942849 isoform X3 [Nicotiana tomentosiformis]
MVYIVILLVMYKYCNYRSVWAFVVCLYFQLNCKSLCLLNLYRLLELLMSPDKKHLASPYSPQKRKQYSAETVSKINCRRRDMYKQLPVDKRDFLLTQCRSKKLELKKGQTALLEYTKQAAGFELPTQKTLTTVERPSVTATDGISSVAGPVAGCDKGKSITDHFSIFEHGSSSGAPYEQHHVETSIVANKDYVMFHFCIPDNEHDYREGSEQYRLLNIVLHQYTD